MQTFPFHSALIHSRNHPHIKRIRALHDRSERDHTGLFYAEGMRIVAQAILHHAPIQALVISHPLMTNPFAHKLALKQVRAGTPILEVTPEVMHTIAQVDDPQGIAAVVKQKWLPIDRVKLGGRLCWIACDAVQSPGNLGTILRTSDAAGGAGLIFLTDSPDPYDPAAVRASMGSLFTQRFVRTTPSELAAWKHQRRWLLVGTSPTAPLDYHAVTYTQPTILLMGSERKGLSEDLTALCDLLVRIPMVGHADSLNVAIATALLLYELFNQKRTASS